MKKILISIILLVVITAALFLFQNKKTNTVQTSNIVTSLEQDTSATSFEFENKSKTLNSGITNEAEEAKWVTYKNEELGFEFQHPEDMKVTYEIINDREYESPYNNCILPYAKIVVGYDLEIQNDVCKIPDFKKLESEKDLKDSLTKMKLSTYTGQSGDDEWRLFYYYFDANGTSWRAQILGEPFNTYEKILKTIKPL